MTAAALAGASAHSLKAEDIRRDAAILAGVKDWDDTDIVEPLNVLCDSLRLESGLNAVGQRIAAARFRNLLAGYIGVQMDGVRHPEILKETIDPQPMVITGLPRCGTTLTHGLLSSDPALRAPVVWEAVRPSPPPDASTWATDPRRQSVQDDFNEAIKISPNLLASLPYSADLKAECCAITQPALRSVAFYAYFGVKAYQDWFLESDQDVMFKYHKRALQQLQWKGPKGRWLLKNPPHIQCPDALFAAYPGLQLVQNHRDPKKVLSSACALYFANQQVNIDNPDKHKIGRTVLDLLDRGARTMIDFRRRRPDIAVVDVYFDELNADPITTVTKVYGKLGLDLTPEAKASMEAWLLKTPATSARCRSTAWRTSA